jgi:hypothetical protein
MGQPVKPAGALGTISWSPRRIYVRHLEDDWWYTKITRKTWSAPVGSMIDAGLVAYRPIAVRRSG